MITITETAQHYLAQLLANSDTPDTNIRIFINQPGTPMAETCIAYCKPGEQQEDDESLALSGFTAFLDRRSLPFLKEARVDFSEDQMGGQLTIKAPFAKVVEINDDSSLEDKINFVLYNEVNPQLAAHGGMVNLMEVVQEQEHAIAILQFGGGCQGCGMADVTLKSGVRKSLLEHIPDLHDVRDITDHTVRDNAYFK